MIHFSWLGAIGAYPIFTIISHAAISGAARSPLFLRDALLPLLPPTHTLPDSQIRIPSPVLRKNNRNNCPKNRRQMYTQIDSQTGDPFMSAPARARRRGVTLIMVAGVLSVLAAMGTGFYTLAVSQTKSATRYSDSVRAELLARAGVSDAIARLREQLYLKAEDPSDLWYQVDYLHSAQRRISFPFKTRADQS